MMKELLAIEQELKEIQEEGNKRIREYQAEINAAIENIDYILKSQAAKTIKEGGSK